MHFLRNSNGGRLYNHIIRIIFVNLIYNKFYYRKDKWWILVYYRDSKLCRTIIYPFIYECDGCASDYRIIKHQPILLKKLNRIIKMITFFAVGDWGLATVIRNKVSSLLKTLRSAEDCLLLLGDNFYPDGVRSTTDPRWIEYESAFGYMKTFAILGNHDYLSDPVAQIMYPLSTSTQWTMPFLFYDVVRGDCHFFFIDTMILAPCETARVSGGAFDYYPNIDVWINKQLAWLERTLRQSTSRWKIVVGHYPIFSGGVHGGSTELQDLLLPILTTYDVDVYLCGHDHSMQHIFRSIHFIVAGSGCMSSPCRSIQGTRFFSSDGGFVLFRAGVDMLEIRFISANTGSPLYKHFVTK
jgi:acid phosphatase